MTPRMSQGCAMVLLLAMMLAMAAGLMAGGPIVITPHDHAVAGSATWPGVVARAVPLLACVSLGATAAWGWWLARHSGWSDAFRAPWLGFFGTVFATAVVAFSYQVTATDAGLALIHVGLAGATTLLTLAFMAERVDALFGRDEAVAGACGVAGCAGLWWFAGHWVGSPGDLRALVFLESLPLLLVPAGAVGLPGEHTRATDWLVLLGLYVLARASALADRLLASGLGGHVPMLVLLAAMTAWAAYRIASESRVRPAWAGSTPTQRSTSLNTSS